MLAAAAVAHPLPQVTWCCESCTPNTTFVSFKVRDVLWAVLAVLPRKPAHLLPLPIPRSPLQVIYSFPSDAAASMPQKEWLPKEPLPGEAEPQTALGDEASAAGLPGPDAAADAPAPAPAPAKRLF